MFADVCDQWWRSHVHRCGSSTDPMLSRTYVPRCSAGSWGEPFEITDPEQCRGATSSGDFSSRRTLARPVPTGSVARLARPGQVRHGGQLRRLQPFDSPSPPTGLPDQSGLRAKA